MLLCVLQYSILTQLRQSTFKGLPTPANAIAVISIVLAGHYSHSPFFSSVTASPLNTNYSITLILSLLMVSRIPLMSLKVTDLKIKGNEGRYILVGLVVASFALIGISSSSTDNSYLYFSLTYCRYILTDFN